MGEMWNRKRSVEESPTQWSVILAILLILVTPCLGMSALGYFFVNGESTAVLLTTAALCLFALAGPIMALFFLYRRSREDKRRREANRG